jgi:AraC-like DNA-binding protein
MKCPNHLCLERVELAPSAEWSVEVPGWCFFRVNEGQGYWLGDNGVHELSAGHVVVLSPLREGFFRSSRLGPVALSYFRFSPELVGGLLTPAESDRFESLAARPAYAVRFFSATAPGARIFAECATSNGDGNALLHRAELLRLISTIFADELQRPVPSETVFLSARQRLRLFLNQIPESEFLRLTPGEMAGRCGSSVTHFNRSFRKLFGVSLGRKQELIRLHNARQALVETTSRVEQIAGDAGFRNVKDFTGAFKKQFGVSPAEWRHPRLRRVKAPANGTPPAAA